MSDELPCEQCKRLGLHCGADDKILAPKTQSNVIRQQMVTPGQSILYLSRPPPSPDNERLTDQDNLYLQFIFPIYGKGTYCSEVFGIEFLYPDVEVPAHRLTFPISSKPLRYAVLALASALKEGDDGSVHSLEYMDQAYRYTREALSDSLFIDIFYTSFVMIQLELNFKQSLETTFIHLRGVSRALDRLNVDPSGLTTDELLWMEKLWRKIFCSLYHKRLKPLRPRPSILAASVEAIIGIIDSHWFVLPSNYTHPQTQTLLEHRMRTLDIYLHYYHLRYLLDVNRVDGTQDQSQGWTNTKPALQQCLRQVIELGRHLGLPRQIRNLSGIHLSDNPRRQEENSTAAGDLVSRSRAIIQHQLLALYSLAVLIDCTLVDPASDDINAEAREAAKSLCRISATAPNRSQSSAHEIRNLFLAGLVLTKSRCPTGGPSSISVLISTESEWIEARLKCCNQESETQSLSFQSQSEINTMSIFLGKADECSIHDIWTLKTEGISLWQCIFSQSGFLCCMDFYTQRDGGVRPFFGGGGPTCLVASS